MREIPPITEADLNRKARSVPLAHAWAKSLHLPRRTPVRKVLVEALIALAVFGLSKQALKLVTERQSAQRDGRTPPELDYGEALRVIGTPPEAWPTELDTEAFGELFPGVPVPDTWRHIHGV